MTNGYLTLILIVLVCFVANGVCYIAGWRDGYDQRDREEKLKDIDF